MIDINKNIEINEQLSKLYMKYSEEYLHTYAEAFNDNNPPCRINEFGVIDVNRQDSENGVLVIGKETNEWSNEEFENGELFRAWMNDVSKTGLEGRGHIKKHPTMWYNIGRWLTAIYDCDEILENVSEFKKEAISKLGVMAYTNINKVRGGSVSKKEYSQIAYSEISGRILKEEIEIINPKIILCCGTWRVLHYHFDCEKLENNGVKVLCMPHPAARKSSRKMIEDLTRQLEN